MDLHSPEKVRLINVEFDKSTILLLLQLYIVLTRILFYTLYRCDAWIRLL